MAAPQDTAWYDQQYNPRETVTDFQAAFDRYDAGSAAALKSVRAYLDVPYGEHPMEKLDIFPAKGESRACLMFIHGGYWRALDKKSFAFLAPAFTKAGVTLANVNYALCPAVTVEDIVRQILQASAWLHRNASNFGAPHGKLYVCGHSAGGHLAAMMLAALWPTFRADLPKKLFRGALAISGVFDLRPLLNTTFLANEVKLDAASARRLSPILMSPATDTPIYTCVGGEESESFHDQSAALARQWQRVFAGSIEMPGENHYTVIERLGDPDSALFKGALRMMGL